MQFTQPVPHASWQTLNSSTHSAGSAPKVSAFIWQSPHPFRALHSSPPAHTGCSQALRPGLHGLSQQSECETAAARGIITPLPHFRCVHNNAQLQRAALVILAGIARVDADDWEHICRHLCDLQGFGWWRCRKGCWGQSNIHDAVVDHRNAIQRLDLPSTHGASVRIDGAAGAHRARGNGLCSSGQISVAPCKMDRVYTSTAQRKQADRLLPLQTALSWAARDRTHIVNVICAILPAIVGMTPVPMILPIPPGTVTLGSPHASLALQAQQCKEHWTAAVGQHLLPDTVLNCAPVHKTSWCTQG